MIYLILYLAVGLLTMGAVAYHDYVLEAEPDDHLSVCDACIYLIFVIIWPVVVALCLDLIVNSLDKVLIWRRKD